MTSEKRIRRTVPRLAFNQRHVKPDLPVVYSGSLRLYPRQALEAWLKEHTIQRGRRVA
jgi:hypothetical protein